MCLRSQKLIWIIGKVSNQNPNYIIMSLRSNKYFHLVMMYLLWITLHYVATHLYSYLCVPLTFYGFVMAPFMVPTPHCQALRWTIYNGGATIANMWILFGAWLIKYIVIG